MKYALKNASRKSLKCGFRLFTVFPTVKLGMITIFRLFTKRIEDSLSKMQLNCTLIETIEVKKTTKSLKRIIKKEKLRASKVNNKSFQLILKKLINSRIGICFKRICNKDYQTKKAYLKTIIKGFLKKSKISFGL